MRFCSYTNQFDQSCGTAINTVPALADYLFALIVNTIHDLCYIINPCFSLKVRRFRAALAKGNFRERQQDTTRPAHSSPKRLLSSPLHYLQQLAAPLPLPAASLALSMPAPYESAIFGNALETYETTNCSNCRPMLHASRLISI